MRILLALLAACHTGLSEEGPICRTSTGLRGGWDANGQNLNGTRGGWDGNGARLQGVQLQGVQIQGSNLNGASLQGTSLVAIGDGGEVEPFDAIGATIDGITTDGRRVRLTISAVEEQGGLTYYSLSDEGRDICGGARGLFLSGVWDETGRRHDSLGNADATFSCTTGVIAKCVRWGYEPWNVGPELHQTCTRMARADYCGDGVAHTQDGTLIDVYDVVGIQVPAAEALVFEAGWGPDGAVCVNHPRYAEQLPSCWREKPSCGDFDEATGSGALIGNASATSKSALCAE